MGNQANGFKTGQRDMECLGNGSCFATRFIEKMIEEFAHHLILWLVVSCENKDAIIAARAMGMVWIKAILSIF